MNPSKTFVAACVLLMFAACGGGGSGGSGNTPTPPPPPTPTFTLGGTVSGLNGSGLVLASNGQTLAVAANGPFTFATAIASGTAYNVTVATQPNGPAQNCLVTDGSGTVGSANVTTVTIACRDVPALTLAGSTPASGANDVARAERLVLEFSAALNAASVSTTSVTLRDAIGSHSVDVSVSGAQLIVTPRRPLLPAAIYTLTVNDTIRGGGREVMSAPVTLSFTTRGSWQTAQLIENEATNVGEPIIGANGETTMVAWQRAGGGLALTRYVRGTGWSGAEFGDFGSMIVPQLAVDAQGTGHIVWYENEGDISSLKASHYTPAAGFSPEEFAETDATGRVSSPRIAVDPAGNVFAIWRYRVAVSSAWANRYTAGSGWGMAQEVDVSPSGIAYPGITVDALGNALALWLEATPVGVQLWSNIYTFGSGWGAPATIGPASSAINTLTFGMNAAGQTVALTSESDTSEDHVVARLGTLGGSWSAPVQLDSDPRISGAFGQKAVVDAAGNAIAVWFEDYTDSPDELWSSRYSAASGWSAAERIGTTGASGAEPDIAVDKAGNALVVWASFDGATDQGSILASRYIAGRGWTPAVIIDPNNDNGAFRARVAIDGDGNAVVVWSQFAGGIQSVEANRFE